MCSEKPDLKIVICESDLRKQPSRAEFSEGMWFLWRLSLNLLKNHILFGTRSEESRFKTGALRKWFEKTTFTSRILKRTVVFEEIKPESIKKPHSFWKSALKSPDLKMVHRENHPHEQKSQKEYVYKRYKDVKAQEEIMPLSLDLLKKQIHCGSL